MALLVVERLGSESGWKHLDVLAAPLEAKIQHYSLLVFEVEEGDRFVCLQRFLNIVLPPPRLPSHEVLFRIVVSVSLVQARILEISEAVGHKD